MSLSDPIADLFTRVRNAQTAGKRQVSCPASKQKLAILKVLKDEGYITDYEQVEYGNNKADLQVALKYFEGVPVIDNLQRVSRPGLRVYRSANELPKVLGGLGVAIVSTSKGIMSDRQARSIGEGGEIIGVVS